MELNKRKSALKKAAAIFAALAVWQIAAMLLDKKILLVSPVDVIIRLTTIWQTEGFFQSLVFTFSRIVFGFFLGLVIGILLALAAGRFPFVETLLWLYMITIKSIPVASFIIIALIWLSSSQLSVFISFLMVLPIIYTNILGGIRSVDRKMLQMADVFRLSFVKRLIYIWLPQIKPFLLSACSLSLGLAWKSGVAAEIIGIPSGSVGEALYYAKVYLDTADLFSWTVIIVIMSVGFEKLFMLLLRRLFGRLEKI